MVDERERSLPSLAPGQWTPEYLQSHCRILDRWESPGQAVVIAEIIEPHQANAALSGAAPRMLDLLLRWVRAADPRAEALQDEARVLITELESASATWVTVQLPHPADSAHDTDAESTNSGEM